MTIERAMDERTIGHNPERMCLLKGGLIYRRAQQCSAARGQQHLPCRQMRESCRPTPCCPI